MTRKIAIGRLSFPRRGASEVFLVHEPACSQPLTSRLRPASRDYGAAGNPFPLRKGRGGKDRRSSYARWNPCVNNAKHRKAVWI
jgi:hypothetical protein